MLIAFIIGCEIAFWVFVLAGLVLRYVFRRKTASTIALLCTPLVDLALLIATVLSLRGGGEATFAHSLAAVYIGASIGFGHRMIRWADVRFAHRFAGGPAPERKTGHAKARHERTGWLLHLLSWAIGCALLFGMHWMIGEPERTAALLQTARIWTIALVVDFFISFSYTFWPSRGSKQGQDSSG